MYFFFACWHGKKPVPKLQMHQRHSSGSTRRPFPLVPCSFSSFPSLTQRAGNNWYPGNKTVLGAWGMFETIKKKIVVDGAAWRTYWVPAKIK